MKKNDLSNDPYCRLYCAIIKMAIAEYRTWSDNTSKGRIMRARIEYDLKNGYLADFLDTMNIDIDKVLKFLKKEV